MLLPNPLVLQLKANGAATQSQTFYFEGTKNANLPAGVSVACGSSTQGGDSFTNRMAGSTPAPGGALNAVCPTNSNYMKVSYTLPASDASILPYLSQYGTIAVTVSGSLFGTRTETVPGGNPWPADAVRRPSYCEPTGACRPERNVRPAGPCNGPAYRASSCARLAKRPVAQHRRRHPRSRLRRHAPHRHGGVPQRRQRLGNGNIGFRHSRNSIGAGTRSMAKPGSAPIPQEYWLTPGMTCSRPMFRSSQS